MAWDDRQVRMLEAMGLRVWQRPAPHARGDGASREAVASQPTLSDGPFDAPQGAAGRAEPRAAGAVPVVRADVETMDWTALRAAVAGCTACGLCASRTTTVFGAGHERAGWMVVGEAPGEQEDLEGLPFVGKAGQLLDRMLSAAGLSRDASDADASQQVFIANVLKCRPPMNRNPLPQEVAQCEPFLRRQVALVQPRVILALGRFAVQSLLGSDEPIGRLRGRVHRYHGVPVIVSYHPAYLLRQPADKARAWDDLCLALEVAGSSPP